MPFFSRFGHPVVTVDQFLNFVGPFLHPGSCAGSSPVLRAKISWIRLGLKSLLLEDWMVDEVEAQPLPLFSGLAILFCIWRSPQGFGHRACLMLILL